MRYRLRQCWKLHWANINNIVEERNVTLYFKPGEMIDAFFLSEWQRHTRKKKIWVLLLGSKAYSLPITSSDALPLSYRRLVTSINFEEVHLKHSKIWSPEIFHFHTPQNWHEYMMVKRWKQTRYQNEAHIELRICFRFGLTAWQKLHGRAKNCKISCKVGVPNRLT